MSETVNMTVRGVAVRLGCTLTHVYNLVRAERLTGAFKQDGKWKVPETAILAYEARSRRGTKVSSVAVDSNRQCGEARIAA
jgi:excisionase family DNA binding protein